MAEHILLIDDDALLRRSLAFSLERAGYGVTTAASAEEGLALVAAVQPQLVLLDIGLPGMDGLDALRQLRRQADLPVIFVTARRRELEQVLGLELGADDYVTKPFDVEVLLARIKAVLRRYRTAEPAAIQPPTAGALVVGDLLIDPGAHTVQVGARAWSWGGASSTCSTPWRSSQAMSSPPEELLTRVWGDGILRRAPGGLRPYPPPAREAGGGPQPAAAHPHRARHRLQAGRPGGDEMRSLRSRLILSHLLPLLVVIPLLGARLLLCVDLIERPRHRQRRPHPQR